jgi:hypothetical protein
MLTKSVAQGAGQQSTCTVNHASALSSTKAVAQGAGPSVDALCYTTAKSAAHGADLDRKLAVVSGKLQSAAQGAGLMTQPMYTPTLPSIAEVAREGDSDAGSDTSSMHDTPVPTSIPTVTHVRMVGGIHKPSFKEYITLDHTVDDLGHVTLKLHLFDRLSHTEHTSEAPPIVQAPTGHKCLKNGRIRKVYKLPNFPTLLDPHLKPTVFAEIMNLVKSYDSLHGHITPALQNWTDAFSDVVGKNSHCPTHWSPLDNAFTHHWGNTNIYAFPPVHDDTIFQNFAVPLTATATHEEKGHIL